MRKILAVISFCALAFAAEPTDLDSLFRGKEYKPVLNASLRDSASTKNDAMPKAAAKASKSDGYYMLQRLL